jgi:hypothetical protein
MTAIYPFITNTTSSRIINLKDPGVNSLVASGSYLTSSLGLYPSSSTSYLDAAPVVDVSINAQSSHLSVLSYDLLNSSGYVAGNSARASGGEIVVSASTVYHIFRNTGNALFTMHDPSINTVNAFVVAGGGAGGSWDSSGGGAGGLVYSSSFAITPGTNIPVVVGRGGFATVNQPGENGVNSVFSTITAIGGGGGGGQAGAGPAGKNGGSGGGGRPSGSGTPGQGFDGGNGLGDDGGGGGGAGGTGSNATIGNGGRGGSGSYYADYVGLGLGSPLGWFAGGGGGGGSSLGGLGGPGGGGNGTQGRSGQNAATNTGGGGGAARSGGQTSGNGGSGIVIISYPFTAVSATGSSGLGVYVTDTTITASANNEYRFGITGSGNLGFLLVSRTGSGVFSLQRNSDIRTISASTRGVTPSDIFFNSANLLGTSSLPLQANLSYASIGAGLTNTEATTYFNLVSQLQTNLKRQNTLLDTYSGAAAAYSLRRIGPSGYFGPAIRVRRDSDNTLRDIGFTSDGQLDTVGLLDFVGVTGSGFVQTWYDQSGNGYDAIQTTAGNQPLTIVSGSVYLDGNKPAIYSPDKSLNTVNLPAHDYLSLYLLGNPLTDPSNSYGWFSVGLDSSYRIMVGIGPTPGRTYYTKGGLATSWTTNLNPNERILYSIDANNSGFLAYTDNTLRDTIAREGVMGGGLKISIGSTQFWGISPANFQEIIYYTSSRRDINTTLNSNILSAYTTGSDPDYQAFITATGITQPTQSAALETLVSDLKSYGLWSKMKAIYPMITDKYNLYSNTETFSSGWLVTNSTVTASNASGPFTSNLVANRLNDSVSSPVSLTVVNNGASAYTINGSDNPTLNLERGRTYVFDINASGHPFYIMTGSGAYTVDGQYNTGVTGQGTQIGTLTFAVPNNAPDTLAYVCQFHSAMGGTINVINNTDQHYIYQTVALQSGSAYVMSTHARWNGRDYIVLNPDENSKTWFDIRNGFVSSSQGTVATASITRVSGTSANPSGSWYRCAMVFTSSVSAPTNTSIQIANTDGDLTYGSLTGLSGSFLWGAQIEPGDFISPYLSNNTSNAFTTGSILDQMKFNLKDPRNTDSAIRLTYSGSWTMGYGGASGNGIDAVGYPKLTPRTAGFSNTSGHISYYQGNLPQVSSGSLFSSRQTAGADNYFSIQTDLGTLGTGPGYGLGGGFASYSIPTPIGFVMANMYSTGATLHQRNQILQSAGIPTLNNIDQLITINATSVNGAPTAYSSAQSRFITIGDGLSNYEAKALYWIVQKYQTTLARQVY